MKYLILLLIKVLYFLKNVGFRVHGLGILQKFLKEEFIFAFNGIQFFYDPRIEGSYDYLLIGKPNEPETHLFLNKLFSGLEVVNYIDVGASVGEFAFGLSGYKNINEIYAFEPRPDCAKVLRKNAQINSETRIQILEYAVDDKGERNFSLYLNPGGSSSGIYAQNLNLKSVQVKTITLDKALPSEMQNPVLLIDVEGAEPLVMSGSVGFIRRNKPLIIFEYNNTSKLHYNISQIEEILGNKYEIYRLNRDGNLDKNLSETWNCVAVPSNTSFSKILLTS